MNFELKPYLLPVQFNQKFNHHLIMMEEQLPSLLVLGELMTLVGTGYLGLDLLSVIVVLYMQIFKTLQ